jgi:hypothetical protein
MSGTFQCWKVVKYYRANGHFQVLGQKLGLLPYPLRAGSTVLMDYKNV